MEVIFGILIITLCVRIHFFIKDIKRRILRDRMLEDEQAITQYIREDMEEERRKRNQ